MNLPWLVLVNLLLVTRLRLLLKDGRASGRYISIATGVQALTFLTFLSSFAQVIGIIFLAVCGYCWWLAESKRPVRELPAIRFLMLVVHVLAFAVVSAYGEGLVFRDWHLLSNALNRYLPIRALMSATDWTVVNIHTCGILLCFNETNLLVRWLIETLELRPKAPVKTRDEAIGPSLEYNRGRVIGVLERIILLTLILQNQFGAIGFVLGAKTLARFKDLDDRTFAEYFLVGTLASLIAAGLVAFAVAYALSLHNTAVNLRAFEMMNTN
jgi:hypothetical protein